jgi:electron transfer flavoprotein beta subunit
VPAPGARINVTADGQAVDTANLGFTMSPHEECALEAGLQLVEEHGGEVTAITLGPPEAEEQLRYAASLGVQHVALLATDGSDWDPQRTARALSDAIARLEAESEPFDVIVFGNESADSGGFQVGIRVARALGRPMVTGAKGLRIDGTRAHVEREIDGTREVYDLPLPAVVGVKEGINLPRYPTMKGRLASRKAVVASQDAVAASGDQMMVRLLPPPEQESHLVVLGEGPGAAAAVVDVLVERGLA